MTTHGPQDDAVVQLTEREPTERIVRPGPPRRFPRASSIKLPSIEFPDTVAGELPRLVSR